MAPLSIMSPGLEVHDLGEDPIDALLDVDEESSTPDIQVEEQTFKGPLLAPENARIFEGSSGESPVFPEAVIEHGADSSSPSLERSGPIFRMAVEGALERLHVGSNEAQEFGEKPLAIVQVAHSILVTRIWPENTLPARNAIVDLLVVMDPITYESADLIDAPWGHLCRVLVAEIGNRNNGLREALERTLPPPLPSVPPPPEEPSPVSKRQKPPPLPPSRRGRQARDKKS